MGIAQRDRMANEAQQVNEPRFHFNFPTLSGRLWKIFGSNYLTITRQLHTKLGDICQIPGARHFT